MSGHDHPIWYYQLKENLCLENSHISGDIAKICKLLGNLKILGTFSMPGYTYPKWQYAKFANKFNVNLNAQKKLFHLLLSWDILLNPPICKLEEKI